jgi:GT2 family glycosyltransferase
MLRAMAEIDVVVVSYNSRAHLRRCVEPLAGVDSVHVVVVDNASQDGSLESIADLPVTRLPAERNGGFSYGCNLGWRTGEAPFVLFLNPDAAIAAADLSTLAEALEADPGLGLVAPRLVHEDGTLAYSLRRFPSLRRAFAQALLVHRLAPRATWADEVVRAPEDYARRWSPDWVSGACMLLRRSLLEELDGFDERFFLYSEDVDICRRVRDAGAGILFEPGATCVHAGGASAPAGRALPVMAKSRQLYAAKHERPAVAALYALAAALSSLTHAAVARDGDRRRGHLRAIPLLARAANGAPPRGAED